MPDCYKSKHFLKNVQNAPNSLTQSLYVRDNIKNKYKHKTQEIGLKFSSAIIYSANKIL